MKVKKVLLVALGCVGLVLGPLARWCRCSRRSRF